MPRNYKDIPIDEIRRKDRAADEKFIKEFLKKSPYCTIASILDDQPFALTNTFFYSEEDGAIYIHTASEGRFRFNVENNNKVCFTTSRMGRLLPADEALEFSVEYESVVVFGVISIIEDSSEAKKILQDLMDKYFSHLTPDVDYRAITENEIDRTAVYKININKWSGKRKFEKPDFPGAFYYKDDYEL